MTMEQRFGDLEKRVGVIEIRLGITLPISPAPPTGYNPLRGRPQSRLRPVILLAADKGWVHGYTQLQISLAFGEVMRDVQAWYRERLGATYEFGAVETYAAIPPPEDFWADLWGTVQREAARLGLPLWTPGIGLVVAVWGVKPHPKNFGTSAGNEGRSGLIAVDGCGLGLIKGITKYGIDENANTPNKVKGAMAHEIMHLASDRPGGQHEDGSGWLTSGQGWPQWPSSVIPEVMRTDLLVDKPSPFFGQVAV